MIEYIINTWQFHCALNVVYCQTGFKENECCILCLIVVSVF